MMKCLKCLIYLIICSKTLGMIFIYNLLFYNNMKKKILFGALLSICIIMLVNTTSAVEFKTVNDFNINLWKSNLDYVNNFLEKISKTFVNFKINTNEVLFKNELIEFSKKLHDLKITILDNSTLPKCIRTIFGFIIGLIFSIIGTIIGIIFGPVLALFVRILTAPAVLLAKLIAFIINIFTP